MISVGNNKAVICKGDFHPAALYKGETKIAGYNVEEFESENGVTLESCYNDKLHDAQIIGNTIQDGTPTPEAPIEIQSIGELTTKNLLNINSDFVSYSNYERPIIEGNTVSSRQLSFIFWKIALKPNTKYILSVKNLNTVNSINFRVKAFTKDVILEDGFRTYPDGEIEGFVINTKLVQNKATFTTPANGVCYYFGWYATEACSMTDIQIEEGSTATEFEPYHKYRIPVRARGKNLFGGEALKSVFEKYISEGYSDTTIDEAEKTVTFWSYTLRELPFVENIFKENTQYTLIFYGRNTNENYIFGNIKFVYTDGTATSANFSVKGSNAFTSRTSEKSKTVKGIYASNAGGFSCLYWDKFGLYEGEVSVDDIEPYIEPQTFNIYLDEPLRKVGDYADYVDFGKDVVMRKIKERTIRQSGTWYKQSNHNDYNTGEILCRYEAVVADKRIFTGGWSDKGELMCNGLIHTKYNQSGVIDKSISERQSDAGSRQIRILTSEYDTIQKMLDAFGDFKFIYILDEQYMIEEPIELPKLPTFKGTTIYEIDTQIPATISGKYKKLEDEI